MFWSGVEVPQFQRGESLLQKMGVRFKNAPSDKTVLVVGAGLCGLVVAYELEKLGFKVKVFEGRTNRIGGRTRRDQL